MPEQPQPTSAARRFGTFGGVFTPCTLTILGVIMFLRFGTVVGNAGVLRALAIVALAKVITTLTALSLSAIATNTRVKGGGAYYLISRSLGIEFGGAIGVVFYLSQAISVALYVIGFTEAFLAVAPIPETALRATASVVNLVVFICVYIGAGWTIRVQYGILGLLVLAIVSFVLGALRLWDGGALAANWGPAYASGESFWTMFALFFPAVTGIMAGANMSGDLKEPGKAIPRGTLAAIGFTAIVYLGFAVLLGASSSPQALRTDAMIVRTNALLPFLIVIGVFAATLSSGLGSMMGAPRILQALARDEVLPFLGPLAKGSGPSGEPRRATVVSFLIAQGAILLGDLNAIAPVITMFFMITYGAINLATFFEAASGNPSYRPTFRWCHWALSLTGAVCCGGVMLLINPLWAFVALFVMSVLYYYLRRQELKVSWGDVVSGAVLERVRRNLLILEQEAYHAKNWRPAILVMGGGSAERLYITILARRLAGPQGLLLLGYVLEGDPDTMLERHANVRRTLRKLSAEHELQAFPSVIIARERTEGIASLVQCCGIGAVRPNMVMFGWPSNPDDGPELEENLSSVVRLGRSIAVLRCLRPPDDPWSVRPGTLDIWWQGKGPNGHLMLLLAYMLRNDPDMRGRPIRILRMLPSESGREETADHLRTLSASVRIPCQPVIVIGDDFASTLRKHSAGAALVFLGMANPCEQDPGFTDYLNTLAADLPNVLFVFSAGDMNLHA